MRDSNCNDEHIAKHANYYNKNSDWGTDSSVELVFEIESYDELTDSEKAKYESLANDSSNNNSVNTNASAEPAENKKSESQKPEQKTDSQENYKMPEDISIYDTKELCERHAESKGYPNAEIKTSTLQGTDMENGKYYKVSGTLYIDEGFTSAERSVGEYACTADYNKWQVTTAYLNRQSL